MRSPGSAIGEADRCRSADNAAVLFATPGSLPSSKPASRLPYMRIAARSSSTTIVQAMSPFMPARHAAAMLVAMFKMPRHVTRARICRAAAE